MIAQQWVKEKGHIFPFHLSSDSRKPAEETGINHCSSCAGHAGRVDLACRLYNPAPVAADDDTFYLDYPTTEVPEGGSVDVYLVRVSDHEHGDYASFGAYWYTQVRSALVLQRRV